MPDLNLSKQRIKNEMSRVSGKGKKGYKVRKTLQQTFSGLKTLLGQMPQGKTEQIRARRKIVKRRIITTILFLFIIAVAILILCFVT